MRIIILSLVSFTIGVLPEEVLMNLAFDMVMEMAPVRNVHTRKRRMGSDDEPLDDVRSRQVTEREIASKHISTLEEVIQTLYEKLDPGMVAELDDNIEHLAQLEEQLNTHRLMLLELVGHFEVVHGMIPNRALGQILAPLSELRPMPPHEFQHIYQSIMDFVVSENVCHDTVAHMASIAVARISHALERLSWELSVLTSHRDEVLEEQNQIADQIAQLQDALQTYENEFM